MKNIKSDIIGTLLMIVLLVFGDYYFLLPWNIKSKVTWVYVIVCLFIVMVLKYFLDKFMDKNTAGVILIPIGATIVFFIIMLASSRIFNASDYSNILKVNEEADFSKDIVESVGTESIALMDTNSAKMLGDREIGSLSNIVSQYDVASYYTQIDYLGKPIKVAPLVHSGFFKWMNNNDKGVPGYVSVNPVSMSAEYHELKNGMIYVPSAYFGQNAERYMHKKYPTELLGGAHFEIDEEGNPYYIASVYDHKIGLFGGKVVKGSVILNPITGELSYYDVKDIPRWVDNVFSGDLLCKQYNWYGELKNGFWNAILGQKGCKVVTSYREIEEDEEDVVPDNDFGYISKDGDIWIYTGVTSVNKDASNIGFILGNQRTGEVRYYSVNGADEASAMSSAEGEVQEKGYQASFPSLINVESVPTYIMVLKDNAGLVKLYAAVNVEQYNIVATATTQKACIDKYKGLLNTENIITPEKESMEPIAEDEIEITISDKYLIDKDGDTYSYIISETGEIYHMEKAVADGNEQVLLLKKGDKIIVKLKENIILKYR